LERGRPGFPQGFSGPVVLRTSIQRVRVVSRTGLSPSLASLSRLFCYDPNLSLADGAVSPSDRGLRHHTDNAHGLTSVRFRLFPFRSPLLGESRLISVPAGTEMFHFPAWASLRLWIQRRIGGIHRLGFPIRTSPDHGLLAAPRGLSQLATSFIAF
jgi:hypothetical protein